MLGNSAICALASLVGSMSFGIGGVLALFLDGPLKLTGVTNVKTMQLLNQLCNESQDNKPMNRDACYGCFFRAASHQSGYPLLLSMANCADNYLNDTNYGHCAEYLKNATTEVSSSVNPTLVYCSFLECVRQVNKDNLSTPSETQPRTRALRYSAPLSRVWAVPRKNTAPVCVIKEISIESNTVRPGAEPFNPGLELLN